MAKTAPSAPKRPPPPRAGGSEGLDEVERALSVLQGRHPEHARLSRETEEAAARRRLELAAAARVDRARRLRAFIVGLLVVGALAAVAWVVNGRRARANAIDALLAPVSAPFTAARFVPLDATSLARADVADVNLDAGTCVVAVAGASGAAPGTATLQLRRDGATTDATGSIGWCTCANEHATVTSTSGPAEGRAVRLLTRDARTFGGATAFAFLPEASRPKQIVESPCADEHLDGWLATKKWTSTPLDAAWLTATPDRATLAHAGFTPVASGASALPFVVIDAAPETCTLVVSDGAADDLSLRIDGGQRVIEHAAGALGFCSAKAPLVTAWHEPGAGALAVVSAPAKRIGGALGLLELATRAHLGGAKLATWKRDEDLAWDATTLLHASGVADPATIDYGSPNVTGAPVPDARIIALAVSGGATVSPDTSSDLVFSTCAPPIDVDGRTVCAQASPQRWRDTSQHGKAAGAQSALPFWMKPYAQTRDPQVERAIVALLGLARRLAPEGFDPTVLEAVTELPAGADVLGRAGEDAIVAVGAEPTAPFVYTYSPDGKAWELGGDPRVVPLPPGKHVTLKPSASASAPLEQRRTIVFRRTAKTR